MRDLATGARRKLTTHASVKQDFLWSPTGARIAVDADNRILDVDVASGRVTEIAHNPAGGYTLTGWSADDRWLVYNRSNASQNNDVYLFDTEARREINVTRDPQSDGNGHLTADGRQVVFTSNRDGGVTHLFVVPLTRMTEDPERSRRARATASRRRRFGRRRTSRCRCRCGHATAAAALNITVDEAGIARRARQLTTRREPGRQRVPLARRPHRSTSPRWTPAARASSPSASTDAIAVASPPAPSRQVTPTPDRRYIFFRQAGGGGGRRCARRRSRRRDRAAEVYRMALATPQRRDRIPFSLTVRVDQRAEWEQIFEESWRVMKYRFYDERMHGTDWDAAKREVQAAAPVRRQQRGRVRDRAGDDR